MDRVARYYGGSKTAVNETHPRNGPPPGRTENLAEQDASGSFLRSIVKVTNPDRYGIVVGDYFV